MPMKIPGDYMKVEGTILPAIPPGGYAEDFKDDWEDLVSRRLKKKFPWMTSPQRRSLAGVAYRRMHRGEKNTLKIVGIDALRRPVVAKYEYKSWRQWAVGQSGDPVDPKSPIRPLTDEEKSARLPG